MTSARNLNEINVNSFVFSSTKGAKTVQRRMFFSLHETTVKRFVLRIVTTPVRPKSSIVNLEYL